MTALCPGGATSSPKPLSPTVVYLSGAALTALAVQTLGLSEAWAALLAFVGVQSWDASTLCSTDPPAMPAFTAADILAIINFDPTISGPAYQKAYDLLTIAAWYSLCQCDAVTTPAAPSAPTYPPTAPIINPPGLPISTVNPCVDSGTSVTFAAPSSAVSPPPLDLTASMLPTGGATISFPDYTGFTATAVLIPTGLQSIRFTLDYTTAIHETHAKLWFLNSVGSSIAADTLSSVTGGSNHLEANRATLPAGAVYWAITAANGYPSQPGSSSFNIGLTAFCTSPTTPATPCCPPDDTLLAQLAQMRTLIELIQRQTAPFAYVASTTHAGLSGEGHFAIQGLIGLRVLLTSIPNNVGIQDSDPLQYWDAGWFNWGNADGSSKREFISCSPQVSFPTSAGQYTRIGYTLRPGVVATITELVREP